MKNKPDKNQAPPIIPADILPDFYSYDYLYNKANNIILDFCADPINGIKDAAPINTTNNIFMAILHDIGRGLFSGLDISADLLLCAIMLDVYIDLACKYDKIISLEGYSFITLIPYEVCADWSKDAKTLNKTDVLSGYISELKKIYIDYYNIYINNKDNKNKPDYINQDTITLFGINNIKNHDTLNYYNSLITSIRGNIFNKVLHFRESAIKNKLLQARQPLGAVAVVNREFGWSAERVASEERARALTLSELPKLTNYVNSLPAPESAES